MTHELARNARQHGLLLALIFTLACCGRMSLGERIEHERAAIQKEKTIGGIQERLDQWAQLSYEPASTEVIRRWAEANIQQTQLSLSPVQTAKLKSLLPHFFEYLAAPSAKSYQDAFPMLSGSDKFFLVQQMPATVPAPPTIRRPSGTTPLARMINHQDFQTWFAQENLPRLIAIAPSSLQATRPLVRTLDGGVISLAHGICTLTAHAASSDVSVAALNQHHPDDTLILLRFFGKVDSSQRTGPFIASFSWDEAQAAWLPRKMCFDVQLKYRILF